MIEKKNLYPSRVVQHQHACLCVRAMKRGGKNEGWQKAKIIFHLPSNPAQSRTQFQSPQSVYAQAGTKNKRHEINLYAKHQKRITALRFYVLVHVFGCVYVCVRVYDRDCPIAQLK